MEQAHENAWRLWLLALVGITVCYAVLRSIVIVRGNALGVLERRWIGRRLPGGRVVALGREVGIQAHVLPPGLHLVLPFIYTVTKRPLLRISENEVGLVEAIDGEPIPQGSIFARVVEGHALFQNGPAFLRLGGQRGPQLEVIPPGLYRVNPYLFR